jgi:hypothetical protein
MGEMSNYPPGFSGGIESEDIIPLQCPNCAHLWPAPMFFELGGWFYYDDEDAFCPKCNTEGVEDKIPSPTIVG